jgi:hypothetical protein
MAQIDLFDPGKHLDEFRSFCAGVENSGRNPLNTEMFFLWSMIRTTRPELFIESGTFRGYSAVFICEALRRNAGGAEFVTFGYNLENCLPYARRRLAEYPFARVIEQDSRAGIRQFAGEQRAAAFFIDGPKGRNMPALFGGILATFRRRLFLAVHDCQPESTSGNRRYLEAYFGWQYPLHYCDSQFELAYRDLDRPLENRAEWQPYHINGVPQQSYGTETGYVLMDRPKPAAPLRTGLNRTQRWLRYHVWLGLKNRIRRSGKAEGKWIPG